MRLRSTVTRQDDNRTNRKRTLVLALFAALAVGGVTPAHALPTKAYGPGIDPYADYQPQTTCASNVQPGVLSFQRMVMREFPNTGEGYFMRSCSVGSTSEHKDGRAWDWMVSVYDSGDKRKVDRLLNWLLKRDKYGHRHARARRIGIMYIIWNRQIWAPWRPNWDPYSGSSPHTDHVHFSFSWDGARKRTTWWHRHRSYVVAAASHPTSAGLWTVTGNANVLRAGASEFHGDRSGIVSMGSFAGIAPTPSGEGYWLVKRNGKVFAYGNARHKGSFEGEGPVVDIEANSTGQGYWIVTKAGRVAAFGSAQHHGNDGSKAVVVALAAAPDGTGYWLLTPKGRVLNFGTAQALGGIGADGVNTVDLEAAPGHGYWIVTRRGRVVPFGTASHEGDATGTDLGSRVVAIVAAPDGNGYWLALANGRTVAYGSSESLEPQPAALPTPRTPADFPVDPAPDEDLFIERFLRGKR